MASHVFQKKTQGLSVCPSFQLQITSSSYSIHTVLTFGPSFTTLSVLSTCYIFTLDLQIAFFLTSNFQCHLIRGDNFHNHPHLYWPLPPSPHPFPALLFFLAMTHYITSPLIVFHTSLSVPWWLISISPMYRQCLAHNRKWICNNQFKQPTSTISSSKTVQLWS